MTSKEGNADVTPSSGPPPSRHGSSAGITQEPMRRPEGLCPQPPCVLGEDPAVVQQKSLSFHFWPRKANASP